MASGAKEVMALAATQVGVHEGKTNGRWNNDQKYSDQTPGLEWSDRMAWCQTFQSWLLYKTGLTKLGPVTASCLYATGWFKNKKRWSEYPALGAQVLFGRNGGSHVELVVGYDSTYVYTIGGNTNVNGSAEGDGVYRKTRLRRDSYVFGYGYPDYEGGSYSADPNATKFGYKHKAVATASDLGKTTTKPKPPKATKFPGAKYFGTGKENKYVTQLGKALIKYGYKEFYSVGAGPKWSASDLMATRAFQRAQGWSGSDADGYPGKETWDRLMTGKNLKARSK